MPAGFGLRVPGVPLPSAPQMPPRPRRRIAPVEMPEMDTPALDAYRAQMSGLPNYADYKPGFGTRLIAALNAGLASHEGGVAHGLQVGQSIKDQAYNRAVSQHSARTKMLGQAAEVEMKSGDSQRKFMKDVYDIVNDQEDNERDEERVDLDRWFKGEQVGNWQRDDIRAEAGQAEDKRWHDIQGHHYGAMEDIGRGNLGVAQTNAGINQQRANDYGRYVDRGGRAANRRIPVLDQDRAKQLAIEELLAEDPSAEKFFRHDDDTGRYYERGEPDRWFGSWSSEPEDNGDTEVAHRERTMKRLKELREEKERLAFNPYDED